MTQSGRWGVDEWGKSPWGGLMGMGGALAITGAFIDSEKTLQLTFSKPPLASSTIGKGDALNPINWNITKVQTGQRFTVLAVNQLSTVLFQPFILEKFYDFNTDHEVDVSAITDTSLIPVMPPAQVIMGGCLAYSAARTQVGPVDIANVPVPGATTLAGTIRTTSSGDYGTQGGTELLRKLIYRRLVTGTGAFFFLPTYGLGISAKGLMSASRLAALQTNVQKQVSIELEVKTCTASLTLDLQHNILTIQLQIVLLQSSQIIPMTIPVQVTP